MTSFNSSDYWRGNRFGNSSVVPQTPAGIPPPPRIDRDLTDDEICERIYNAFDANPTIPWDCDLEVDANEGVVTLRGNVPSRTVKRAAGDDAWGTPGVEDVLNCLRILS